MLEDLGIQTTYSNIMLRMFTKMIKLAAMADMKG